MPLRCVNCSLNVARMRRHRLSEERDNLFEAIKRWTYPQDITRNDYICHSCWELVNHSLHELQSPPQVQVGHRNICIVCGRSILRSRKRLIMRSNNSEIDQGIVSMLSTCISPRQITPTDELCVPCWLKAKRAIDRHIQTEQDITWPNAHEASLQDQMMEPTQEPTVAQTEELVQDLVPGTSGTAQLGELQLGTAHVDTTQQDCIRLPNIRRAANTGARCIFINCNNFERCHVPTTIRRRVIKDYNFYIPTNARMCRYHLQSNLLDELYGAEDAMSTIRSSQIEEMVFLLSEETITIDFKNPEEIDENLFHYWFG